jgi:hypothetical protein
MADTHDERGGDKRVARANRLMDKCRQRGQASLADVEALRNDVVELAEQLAAATARAEKAERERDVWKSEAERRSAERNAAVRRIGLVRECLNAPGELLSGLAELLANGTARALSATETGGEGVRESVGGNTSSILPQGLSEPEPPRDTAAWCWAPNPNGPLRCGRLRDHEPPHRRGERT